MFELSTVDVATAKALSPEPSGVCVREWAGTTGAVRARAYVGAGRNWIVWDGVGTFRFTSDGKIEALPAKGANLRKVQDLYYRHILPLVMQANGLEAIHASAVTSDRGVLGFCGPGGVGKSTIAYALSRRGFPQYADDALVMEPAGGRVEALSLPFLPRLRAPAAEFFGHDLYRHLASDLRSHSERTPVAALFVLERTRSGANGPEIRRCSSVDAFSELVAHAQRFDTVSLGSRKRHLQNFLDVTAAVPVFSVRFANTFDQFDDLLDQLIATAGVARPPRSERR
jgi:hypothetical protein